MALVLMTQLYQGLRGWSTLFRRENSKVRASELSVQNSPGSARATTGPHGCKNAASNSAAIGWCGTVSRRKVEAGSARVASAGPPFHAHFSVGRRGLRAAGPTLPISSGVERRQLRRFRVERGELPFAQSPHDDEVAPVAQANWHLALPRADSLRSRQEPFVVMPGEHQPVRNGVEDALQVPMFIGRSFPGGTGPTHTAVVRAARGCQ